MQNLDAQYWNNRYLEHTTGWDLGEVSPPLKAYIDQLEDKSIRILIPGCGNSYEASYLLGKGFTDITVIDLAPALTVSLQQKFPTEIYPSLKIINGDFFELEDKFELVLEQTFFCALLPSLREGYAQKMNSILKPGGKIAGVLFNREFEGGPPFGGNEKEYRNIFAKYFQINILAECYNSIQARSGSEVFFECEKK
jgi:SAM-dependent methyltransferase